MIRKLSKEEIRGRLNSAKSPDELKRLFIDLYNSDQDVILEDIFFLLSSDAVYTAMIENMHN